MSDHSAKMLTYPALHPCTGARWSVWYNGEPPYTITFTNAVDGTFYGRWTNVPQGVDQPWQVNATALSKVRAEVYDKNNLRHSWDIKILDGGTTACVPIGAPFDWTGADSKPTGTSTSPSPSPPPPPPPETSNSPPPPDVVTTIVTVATTITPTETPAAETQQPTSSNPPPAPQAPAETTTTTTSPAPQQPAAATSSSVLPVSSSTSLAGSISPSPSASGLSSAASNSEGTTAVSSQTASVQLSAISEAPLSSGSSGNGTAGEGHAAVGSKPATNAGVIAGIVVGGVVGLALLGLLVWFIGRDRKRQREFEQVRENNSIYDARGDMISPLPQSAASPGVSHPAQYQQFQPYMSQPRSTAAPATGYPAWTMAGQYHGGETRGQIDPFESTPPRKTAAYSSPPTNTDATRETWHHPPPSEPDQPHAQQEEDVGALRPVPIIPPAYNSQWSGAHGQRLPSMADSYPSSDSQSQSGDNTSASGLVYSSTNGRSSTTPHGF